MNKSYYAILPAVVRYNTKLPAAVKLFYAEITALTNAAGYCYASNKYFMELYAVSERTVRDWLAVLKREKMVKVQLIKDGKNQVKERRIYLVDPGAENCPTPGAEFRPTPGAENCRYNSIGVNNIDSFIINNKTSEKKLNSNLKTAFLDHYQKEKGAAYYWTAKDAGNLTQLIKKIGFTLNEAQAPSGPAEIETSFTALLAAIKRGSWLDNNLSIPLINNQFNQIISNYGKETRNNGAQLINEMYR